MAERAGFEPDKKVNDTSGNTAKIGVGTEIGTTTVVTCRHGQSCSGTDGYSDDLQEVLNAWSSLSSEIRSAVIAIVRSQETEPD